ncbi:hypothetical protein D7036_03720 [Aquimarina sp. BL5]|nr:hypothetical protein D7036_03720 [Aquimarina sp. BL5]
MSGFSVFGQVNLNSSSGRVKDIDTDFLFRLTDKQYDRILLQSGWLSGIGDYLSFKHGGGNTEAGTYGFRISDAQGFDFGKNDFSTSFLKIMTNGNIGIGTTSPQSKLEIKQSGTIGGTWNPSGSFLTISDSGSSKMIMDSNEIYGNGTLHIGSKTGDIIKFRTISENSTSDKVVIKADGKVGIGTNSPQAGLHIANNTGLFIDDSASGFPGRISMTDGFTNASTKDDMLFESDGAFIFKLDRNGNGISNLPGFGVYNKNNEAIFFAKDNGNVGIGTSTPDAKLAVNGNIHTKEVKVDLIGWADYVFKEGYNLPTLEQVEDHIATKGHLINIPSAAEVAENGIQLGAMNAKLLEKIEELTLYTIAQEKKLQKQEERLKKLETLLVKK